MSTSKAYSAPHVFRHGSEADYPAWARDTIKRIRQEMGVEPFPAGNLRPDCVTLVNTDRRFVEVSDSFCKIVGYKRRELIGKQYDDVTAPDSNDIQMVFNLFSRLGYMQGLWMLMSREGNRILVRYETWLRPDTLIEAHMEVLGAGY